MPTQRFKTRPSKRRSVCRFATLPGILRDSKLTSEAIRHTQNQALIGVLRLFAAASLSPYEVMMLTQRNHNDLAQGIPSFDDIFIQLGQGNESTSTADRGNMSMAKRDSWLPSPSDQQPPRRPTIRPDGRPIRWRGSYREAFSPASPVTEASS